MVVVVVVVVRGTGSVEDPIEGTPPLSYIYSQRNELPENPNQNEEKVIKRLPYLIPEMPAHHLHFLLPLISLSPFLFLSLYLCK